MTRLIVDVFLSNRPRPPPSSSFSFDIFLKICQLCDTPLFPSSAPNPFLAPLIQLQPMNCLSQESNKTGQNLCCRRHRRRRHRRHHHCRRRRRHRHRRCRRCLVFIYLPCLFFWGPIAASFAFIFFFSIQLTVNTVVR